MSAERPDNRERPQQRQVGGRDRAPRHDSVRIFVGAGRFESLRPGDLVGAITNETGLTNASIGAIEIADRFSLVEVATEHAERIIQALRGTKLRGRRVIVRRDRGEESSER